MSKLKTYAWKDPTSIARIAAASMIANIVTLVALSTIGLAFAGATWMKWSTAAQDAQIFRGVASALHGLALLACLSAVGWIVRVSKNAHVFRPNMRFSPWGSVIWYVVPVACLALPYEAMSEILSASAPTGEERGSGHLINWWWGTSLAGQAAYGALLFLPKDGQSLLVTAGDAVTLTSSILFLRILRQVTASQLSRHTASVFSDDGNIPQLSGKLVLSSI